MNNFQEISSKNNQKIKNVKKLHRKKYREEAGLFICEGIRVFKEALNSNVKIDSLFIDKNDIEETEKLLKDYSKGFDIYIVSKDIIETMSTSVTPQGYIFLVDIDSLPKTVDNKEKSKVYVYLDELQDPGNLGTIIRTSHGTLVDAVFIGENTVDPFSDKSVRSTMGSLFKVPIIYKTKEDLILLKKNGFSIVTTSLDAKKSIFETDLTGNIVIVIGNEGRGVSSEILNISDTKVIIPMPGDLESLNAGVSFSVVIYERLRQINY